MPGPWTVRSAIRERVYGGSMAARQKATRHELEDGFVVAWDSSDIDEDLRRKLIKRADNPISDIIVSMGGEVQAVVEVKAPAGRSRKAASARRQRRAAA